MYTISELNAKSLPELKAIAEGMGLKKIDSLLNDDLIYKILDQQAIDGSKVSAANMPEKKKRGRRPKVQKAEAVAVKKEDAPKRRLGRYEEMTLTPKLLLGSASSHFYNRHMHSQRGRWEREISALLLCRQADDLYRCQHHLLKQ